MAVLNLGCGGKENAPPAAAAVRGIAVKNQIVMKRTGAGGKAARRRPPLRDITGLFLASPCRPSPPAALPALADAEVPEAAVRARAAGGSDGAAARQGRYSLKKGFR